MILKWARSWLMKQRNGQFDFSEEYEDAVIEIGAEVSELLIDKIEELTDINILCANMNY